MMLHFHLENLLLKKTHWLTNRTDDDNDDDDDGHSEAKVADGTRQAKKLQLEWELKLKMGTAAVTACQQNV